MPRNVINNIFYFLESETATIFEQEIKRNKKHIIKGSDIISDYALFTRPRVDFVNGLIIGSLKVNLDTSNLFKWTTAIVI